MITALYASLLAILIIVLGFRVSKNRLKYKIGIGAGENLALDLAIRCHANAVETIPVAVLMLLLAELQQMSAWGVHIAGIILVLCRILHPIGLTKAQGGANWERRYGTIGSWLTIIVLAVSNISLYIASMV